MGCGLFLRLDVEIELSPFLEVIGGHVGRIVEQLFFGLLAVNHELLAILSNSAPLSISHSKISSTLPPSISDHSR